VLTRSPLLISSLEIAHMAMLLYRHKEYTDTFVSAPPVEDANATEPVQAEVVAEVKGTESEASAGDAAPAGVAEATA
jgi:hypothetical protein